MNGFIAYGAQPAGHDKKTMLTFLYNKNFLLNGCTCPGRYPCIGNSYNAFFYFNP